MSHYEVVENKVAVDRVVISQEIQAALFISFRSIRNIRNKFFKFSKNLIKRYNRLFVLFVYDNDEY